MNDYQPINCNYYDIILAHATKKEQVEVIYYTDSSTEQSVEATILDVFTRLGEEFLLLSNQSKIRLDKIVSVGGIHREGFGGTCSLRF